MLARAGELPRPDRGWAYEIKWDGVRALAYCEPGELRLESRNLIEITTKYPELAELSRALGSRSAILDGEIVAFDVRRAAQLLRPPAAHADLQPAQARRQDEGHARHLRDLRPAVAGRTLADRGALQRAARAAGRPGADRLEPPGARVPRRPRLRAVAGRHRPGPRGRPRQAPSVPLPARQAHRRLAEDQAPRPPGVRGRRMDRPARAIAAGESARCCWACTTATARLRYVGARAAASASASSTASARCSTPLARERSPFSRRRTAAGGTSSASPSWWSRCPSASGPPTGACATRCTWACARTRRPRRSCARTRRRGRHPPLARSAARPRRGAIHGRR